MSEEEAIKILKEITPDDLLNCWEGGEKEFNAIETILDLYQQEKEKNKELTDFIEAIEELKQAKKPVTDLVYEMNKFKDDFINKDKIRAKIEEINSLKHSDERLDRATIDFIINKFYRLLEEE